MDSPLSPTPAQGHQQPLDSPDMSQLPSLPFGHRRNFLPTRRLIDFEFRQSNTTYQHVQDSLVRGEQKLLRSTSAPEFPPPPFESEDPFLSAHLFSPGRHIIDPESPRRRNPAYQHGRDSPVWGEQTLLRPRSAPELPQPPFQPKDLLLSAHSVLPRRRLIHSEKFRRRNPAYQYGLYSPVWGQRQPPGYQDRLKYRRRSSDFLRATRRLRDFDGLRGPSTSLSSSRASPVWDREKYLRNVAELRALFPPEVEIIYSNGWLNEVPIHPTRYGYAMLPIRPSQYGRYSPVSSDSESLSDDRPDQSLDPYRAERRLTHNRFTSVERACKAWAIELTNSVSNPNGIDDSNKDLFGSLERLEPFFVQDQPDTVEVPKPFVKQPSNGYILRKLSFWEEPAESVVDVEEMPHWTRPMLGIRLPPGMVNLLQYIKPYLVRHLRDPLIYFPSKLLFEENSPFDKVIPKKGQIGLHPTFRTAAPEDILEAERALKFAKENRVHTPEEAWRSPVIGEYNSEAEGWSLMDNTLTAVDSPTSPINELEQVFVQWMLEYRGYDEESFKSVLFDQTEPSPDVDQELMFSVQGMGSPGLESVTMFSGLGIGSDQGLLSLDQGMKSPVVCPALMQPPIGDQVRSASDPGTEGSIDDEVPRYFGLGIEYLIEDEASGYLGKDKESPGEHPISICSGQDMDHSKTEPFPDFYDEDTDFPNEYPLPLLYEQDIEHPDQDDDSTSSSVSTDVSLLLHEDIPIIRWWFDGEGQKSNPPVPSSKQTKKIKEPYKRNSEDFAHLPPIDFTKPYTDFYTSKFGKFLADGGLEDYGDFDEEAVEKTEEVTENPRVTTETYDAKDHEARMRELFAEIELEGAMQILTTWQGVYADRAEEEGPEEGVEEKGAGKEQALTALGDINEVTQEQSLSMEQKHAMRQSWFGIPSKREVIKERRKSQGAEAELNGKQISWLGAGLISAGDEQAQESFNDGIGQVTPGPADLSVTKSLKRVSWFGELSLEKEDALGDSREKQTPRPTTPLERRHSKRASWFGGHTFEKESRTKADLEGNPKNPRSPASIHPLERKGSKRRSWFPGYSAERVIRRSEDGHRKLTRASSNPPERKGSKRKSWFGGHHGNEERGEEGLDVNIGKSTPASAHQLDRKPSKRRSLFGDPPTRKREQSKEYLINSLENLTPAPVHPLERKVSKRRSLFGRHPDEEGERSKDSLAKSIKASVHSLERKLSKRTSLFGRHPANDGAQSKSSLAKSSQPSVNPLERKASKRRSWFGVLPPESDERIGDALRESQEKIPQEHVQSLGRKHSKRMTWFGGTPAKKDEKSKKSLERSKGDISQETANPSEQTKEVLNGGKRDISHGTTVSSEQTRAKRASWFGGLSVQKEKQTKQVPDDSHNTITQESTDASERKRAKRASWFGVPIERSKSERKAQEERKRKRSSLGLREWL
ncbi:hypothetical protein V494_00129 [Pseudogymnoascus sp. VKM F-4513 (FW-928)]|nr:hypothetical protein V494_00129 [Pseudogymnoascus sp. VKM F-4513 (FW-928)]